jgi:sterol desaturase/sphingolipid hydroxylase (fatty acid hydroxylase superfamily)
VDQHQGGVMQEFSVAELIPVLQTAIGPVILISGVGLLLLTMTNRLGRAIDRARILDAQIPELQQQERKRKVAQLSILWRRARIIQVAITFASTSALCAAILIVLLFLTALLQIENPWLISTLFILCVVTLISSLLLFIHDVNQSLAALKLELEDTK